MTHLLYGETNDTGKPLHERYLDVIKDLIQDIENGRYDYEEDIESCIDVLTADYIKKKFVSDKSPRDGGVYTVGDLREVLDGVDNVMPIMFRDSEGDWNNNVTVFLENGCIYVEGN